MVQESGVTFYAVHQAWDARQEADLSIFLHRKREPERRPSALESLCNGLYNPVLIMTISYFIIPNPNQDSSGFAPVFLKQISDAGWIRAQGLETADILFVFDHPRRFSRIKRAITKASGKKVLLRFEPNAVNPILYRKSTVQIYDIVLNIGGRNHLGSHSAVLRWPYFSHLNPAKPNANSARSPRAVRVASLQKCTPKRYRASLVVSNKVSWSSPSNYALRQRLVLNRKYLDLNTFGMHWSDSRFQRLRRNFRLYLFFLSQGVIPRLSHLFENIGFTRLMDVPSVTDKFEILSESEFHLVVENSSTYVSEKLIDAMIGGAIPIYYGPPLSDYGIPSDCYIPFPHDPKDQLRLLQSLHRIDKEIVKKRIDTFLNSANGLTAWMPETVAKDIMSRCL